MSLPQLTDTCPCGRLAPAGPGGSKGKSVLPLPFASCCGRYLAAPVVEFVARYRVAGRAVRLHETSRFVREGGRWFYVDGDLHG